MKTGIVYIIGALALAFTLVTVLIGLPAIRIGASSSVLPMLQPAPNTHDAPITTSIVVTFATAIDPSTVSARTIAILRGAPIGTGLNLERRRYPGRSG